MLRSRLNRLLFSSIGAAFVLVTGALAIGVRPNYTASVPLGLYIITNQPTDYVAFCLAGQAGRLALQRHYVAHGICSTGGAPLLKHIVGLPGDTVTLSSAGISVNGNLLKNTEPKQMDDWGNRVAHYPFGTYYVRPDTYWVASTYDDRSYDSRYYGPIHSAEIVAHVKPLWVSR